MKSIKSMLESLQLTKSYLIDREIKTVLTREQLGEALACNYAEAVEVLENGSLEASFKLVDEEAYKVLKTFKKDHKDPNHVIFFLSYYLNPNLLFTYKEINYRDIAKLGRDILAGKADEKVIIECLTNGLITYYSEVKKLNTINAKIFDQIKLSLELLEKDEKIAYGLLGYVLANREFYIYDGKQFDSIEGLYIYLVKEEKLNKFSKTFESDVAFIAWIYMLGKGEQYFEWFSNLAKVEKLTEQANYKREVEEDE